MINKNFLILQGGNNEEHEVSISTSREIQKILKKNKIRYKTLNVNPKNFEKKIIKFKNFICFNALHGPFGEDGQVQKILKNNNIKYTHSGIKSSKLCFDKFLTKKIITKNKILTPKFTFLKKNELNKNKLHYFRKLYKKFVIKPSKSGSSFGVKIIKNNSDFLKFTNKIEKFKKIISLHEDIIVEEFISGKELTVSTIKFSGKIEALAVTEIKYKNKFFDYQAKYSKGFAKHILPAKLTNNIYNKCLNLAIKSHAILGCGSIARTDFLLNYKNNKIYYLETNSQPGLTSMSLLPEQAKFKNISFENLIFNILKKNI